MALESIATGNVRTTTATLNFDQINSVHEHLAKARAIVELVSGHAHKVMGYNDAAVISDGLWAATTSLDQLAVMLGLDPTEQSA